MNSNALVWMPYIQQFNEFMFVMVYFTCYSTSGRFAQRAEAHLVAYNNNLTPAGLSISVGKEKGRLQSNSAFAPACKLP